MNYLAPFPVVLHDLKYKTVFPPITCYCKHANPNPEHLTIYSNLAFSLAAANVLSAQLNEYRGTSLRGPSKLRKQLKA